MEAGALWVHDIEPRHLEVVVNQRRSNTYAFRDQTGLPSGGLAVGVHPIYEEDHPPLRIRSSERSSYLAIPQLTGLGNLQRGDKQQKQSD